MIESLPIWLDGRVVMQRPAKPCTPVRFRLQPPWHRINCLLIAQVVELVDTRDLKSLEGNFVPVQVRLWAPMLKNT